jgi:hypothetical protein
MDISGESGIISHKSNLRNCLIRAMKRQIEEGMNRLFSQKELLYDSFLQSRRASKVVIRMLENHDVAIIGGLEVGVRL